MPRAKSTKGTPRSSRASSTIVLSDDDETADTAATTPAAPEQVEKDGIKALDTAAQEKPANDEVKPAQKPAHMVRALRDMMSKTKVYLDRIEETRRAAAGEVVENGPPKKKQKKAAQLPPMNMPQGALITGGTLKDYQLEGQNWLIQRYIFALHGAILADEMGTGKTLQSISFVAFIYEHIHKAANPKTDKPSIVIMPKPVLHNWEAEFKLFAPAIPTLVYAGTPEERGELRQKFLGLRGHKNAPAKKRKSPFPVILVSYGIALKDIAYLKNLEYDLVICDEAHKAKNLKGKTLNSLQLLKSSFRLLLTGTPLQNNLTELYALLFFIFPDIFADQQLFESQFDFSSITDDNGTRLSETEEVQLLVMQLQALLTPFMLRRCKKDVVKDLPLKKEYVLTAPLTARQKELTDAAVKGELRAFLAGEAEQKRAEPPVKQRRSREVAMVDLTEEDAKPGVRRTRSTRGAKRSYSEAQDAADDDEFEDQVLERAERKEREEQEAMAAKIAAKPQVNLRHKQAKFSSAMTNLRQIANHPLLKLDDRDANSNPEDIVNLSGKMMLLDRLLPELFKQGHKVIIFSQFTQMLDLLDDYIELREWDRYRIDGRGENNADQEEIKDFNSTPCSPDGVNLFLLSTRAGGVGLNLVGADTVIIFDSDWNPQNDLQAMDRAHRIGQKKPVLVFRLATANTVEQTILASATRKRKLERVVLGNDTLSGDAGDILNKAKGRKTGGHKRDQDTMRQLAEQLASAEGEKITLADAGAEILSNEQLAALLDRSDEAMQSNAGSSGEKGKTNAAFEVVETIEEETTQQQNDYADLLGAMEDDPSAPSSAVGTDDED
ncbi:hypothetical protein JCM10213_007936 [Rhodosporidiobolus nylandii]